ncbi:hypothetical protein SH591_14840 [Sphingomonas sp. LY54]|uniref:hypothetical protein n=1 Tax=Sphingomonas sp. LY54 TaxID=3095343 RepID=UPI002D76CEE4|nr:hypothetical protein [Sphingomonas sp. LY54]WRP28357.1 hypothetical protein SH591_14840 [Sphingomonas sp. LY54]
MKQANATVLRTGPLVDPETKSAGASPAGMSEALRRYPDIDDALRLQLIHFLNHGHPDEIARATYGAGLDSELAAFKKNHPEHFKGGLKAWVPLILFLVVPLLVILGVRFAA